MKRFARPLAIFLALVSISACLERKQTATINPDGSGKIVIDSVLAIPADMPAPGGKPDPAVVARQVATGLITKSQGVDAWKDVVVEVNPDGRAHVAMTAYFPDVSRLKLDLPIPMKWTKDD